MDPDIAPAERHHHRDVQGGAARAAVFGFGDGLTTNVGLILGVAGADSTSKVVQLSGLLGLVAGAVSMAAGEYNSMRVQQELIQRELDLERIALDRFPHVETVELTQIYQARGIEADQARALAEAMMSDPDRALEAHAREELGISPDGLGSPWQAAFSSCVSFALGALVPLVPWFIGSGTAAKIGSLVAALVAAVVVSMATARFTGRSRARTVLRQLVVVCGAVTITYVLGVIAGGVIG